MGNPSRDREMLRRVNRLPVQRGRKKMCCGCLDAAKGIHHRDTEDTVRKQMLPLRPLCLCGENFAAKMPGRLPHYSLRTLVISTRRLFSRAKKITLSGATHT